MLNCSVHLVAPYVEPEMNWWPIIVALSITGAVLIVVFILIGCAFCKNKQRKEERFRRRDSLRASMRASKASILTTNTNLAPEVGLCLYNFSNKCKVCMGCKGDKIDGLPLTIVVLLDLYGCIRVIFEQSLCLNV